MSFSRKFSASLFALVLAIGASVATAEAQTQAGDFQLGTADARYQFEAFGPRFIEMVEKATNGRVTAEIKYKLAPPPGAVRPGAGWCG